MKGIMMETAQDIIRNDKRPTRKHGGATRRLLKQLGIRI